MLFVNEKSTTFCVGVGPSESVSNVDGEETESGSVLMPEISESVCE